ASKPARSPTNDFETFRRGSAKPVQRLFTIGKAAKMSTSLPPAASAVGIPAPAMMRGPEEIRLYGHSTLFYWWPVWALGFILTLIPLIDNTRVIHVPGGTAINKLSETSYELVNSNHPDEVKARLNRYLPGEDQRQPPRVSHRAWMGATFCIVLILVTAI